VDFGVTDGASFPFLQDRNLQTRDFKFTEVVELTVLQKASPIEPCFVHACNEPIIKRCRHRRLLLENLVLCGLDRGLCPEVIHRLGIGDI